MITKEEFEKITEEIKSSISKNPPNSKELIHQMQI